MSELSVQAEPCSHKTASPAGMGGSKNQWVVILVGPIAALAVLALGVKSETSPSPLTWLLLLANLAVSWTGLSWATLKSFRPVSYVYFLFTLGWLGIAPVVQVLSGQAAWGDWQVVRRSDDVNAALTLLILGNLGFFTGVRLSYALPGRKQRDEQTSRRARVYLLALTALLAVVLPAAISAQGGVASRFQSRWERFDSGQGIYGAELGVSQGLFNYLPVSLGVAVAIISIREFQESRGRGRVVPLLGVSVSMLALALMANPISATRFISAIAWGSVLLTTCWPRRRWASRALLVLGLGVVLFAYPSLSQTRNNDDIEYATARTWTSAMTSGDFDGFQQTVNAQAYAQTMGHTKGMHSVSAALFFVPRSVWHEKAEPATLEVSEFAGYWFTDLSLPIQAELFLDWGMGGMPLALLGLGMISGLIDRDWGQPTWRSGCWFAPLVAPAMLAIVRGPLTSLVGIYLPAVLILWLWIILRRANHNEGVG